MSSIKTVNRRVETFLVAKQGQTALPTSGALYANPVPLNDGQLGVVADSAYGTVALNNFVDATPIMTEAPEIAIVQGTPYSAAPQTASVAYPLWPRVYEKSKTLDGRREIRVTKQSYRAPAHNVWILGSAAANADAINPLSNTTYTTAIAFKGARQENQYSLDQAAELNITFTTPDFSAAGLNYNDAQSTAWIAHEIGYGVNRNSKAVNPNSRFPGNSPVVAFVIRPAGGSGVAIGGVSPITAGTSVPVITTPQGTYSIVLTADQATSIKNAALAVAGGAIVDLTWTIVPAQRGAVIGDVVMFMALDEVQAWVDAVPQVKVGLKVGLRGGFGSAVKNTELVYEDEGQGIGRVLNIQYKNTAGQRKYTLNHTEDPYINFPSPVDESLVYTTYVFHHSLISRPDSYSFVERPAKEIVLIPQYSTGTTLNPYLATFEGVINSFLTSSNNGVIFTAE